MMSHAWSAESFINIYKWLLVGANYCTQEPKFRILLFHHQISGRVLRHQSLLWKPVQFAGIVAMLFFFTEIFVGVLSVVYFKSMPLCHIHLW